jgi:thioredoxin reductase (NADPH)
MPAVRARARESQAVDEIRDIIVIGGGPAGYTAALYAARANLHPLVIEGSQWGGQLMITSDVENFPGYPGGILGPAMMADFRAQAERFGTEFVSDDVTRVDFSERPFRIWVGEKEYRAKAVIVATGANARQLGLESERAFHGRGVSYCATCDGFFFRDKHVVVVGGGDSAMEEATFLTRFAEKVTVVHRRDDYRASTVLLDRACANEKIEWITMAAVDEVIGGARVKAIRLRDVETGAAEEITCDGVFVAIGHDPNTELFRGQLVVDEAGYIITDVHHFGHASETSVPGVFAAGDVSDPVYRQAVTAAGSGCQAALDAELFLGASGH